MLSFSANYFYDVNPQIIKEVLVKYRARRCSNRTPSVSRRPPPLRGPPLIELRPLKDPDAHRPKLGTELASMDSTETFASCATHPFPSQADLTADASANPAQKDSSNLYVNPLDDPRLSSSNITTNSPCPPLVPQGRAPLAVSESIHNSPVKKRVLRSQAYVAEMFDDSKSTDRLLISSCSSLQDSPQPKHRRTRFQEVCERRSPPAKAIPSLIT